jgi:hypothetical protein
VQHFEPVHARHLDVKEYHIRRQLQNPLYGANAVSTFANDLHVFELTQPVNDTSPRQGFVVDD